MSRDLEKRLRSEATSVRRAPSDALGRRVREAMVAGSDAMIAVSDASIAASDGSIRDPFDEGALAVPWRERLKAASVAALVLAAAGFWVVALFGVLGGDSDRGGRTDLAKGTPPSAVTVPDSPGLLAALGRVVPLENPLSAELDRIGQDATRAARFLVGRLPAALAANAEDARR